MRERPILFSGPMIRQILAGRKTQTRRPIKAPAKNMQRAGMQVIKHREPGDPWYGDHVWSMRNRMGVWGDYTHERFLSLCPYYADRLWVRETFWSQHDTDGDDYRLIDLGPDLSLGPEFSPGWEHCATPRCESPPDLEYEQTVVPHEGPPVPGEWWLGPPDDWNEDDEDRMRRGQWLFLPWDLYTKHPSIHMPRWASRLILDVLSIRAERIQDISEGDARAEGLVRHAAGWTDGDCLYDTLSARDAFGELWEGAYPGSWQRNDWVWVIEFPRVGGAQP